MHDTPTVTRQQIIDWIEQFIATSPLNTMQDDSGEPAWDAALVGFASGADPLWQQYKNSVYNLSI